MTSGKPRGARPSPAASENRRFSSKPVSRRHSRHGFRRRPRSRDGLPLSRRRCQRASRPTGSETRHHSRRGRHATSSSSSWRRQSSRNVHQRQSGQSAGSLQFGIVDRIIEGDLLPGAIAFAREIAAKPAPKTRERNEKLGTAADRTLPSLPPRAKPPRKKQRGLMAPLAAIDAIEAATTLPFAEGCQARTKALHRVPLLRSIQSADPRFLQRTRSRQNSRRPKRHVRSFR